MNKTLSPEIAGIIKEARDLHQTTLDLALAAQTLEQVNKHKERQRNIATFLTSTLGEIVGSSFQADPDLVLIEDYLYDGGQYSGYYPFGDYVLIVSWRHYFSLLLGRAIPALSDGYEGDRYWKSSGGTGRSIDSLHVLAAAMADLDANLADHEAAQARAAQYAAEHPRVALSGEYAYAAFELQGIVNDIRGGLYLTSREQLIVSLVNYFKEIEHSHANED